MKALHAAAVALAIAGAAGCGGGEAEQLGRTTTRVDDSRSSSPCSPGVHAFKLQNGQSVRMRVTSGGQRRAERSSSSCTAPADRPTARSARSKAAGTQPGLVLIAPASKGQTWSILRSEEDHDLESVNLALAEAYERCEIDRTRIAVGGFSDGGTYALTLGLSNGELFRSIMALSPGGIVGGQQAGVPRVFVSHGTARRRPADRAGGRRRRRASSATPATRSSTTGSWAATKLVDGRRRAAAAVPAGFQSAGASGSSAASARRARSRRRRRR